MFPYANYAPPRLLKCPICTSVALTVALKLLSPPFLILNGSCAMYGAAVPEAPVDKNGDARRNERYVWTSADPWHNSNIDAVSQSAQKQRTPKG